MSAKMVTSFLKVELDGYIRSQMDENYNGPQGKKEVAMEEFCNAMVNKKVAVPGGEQNLTNVQVWDDGRFTFNLKVQEKELLKLEQLKKKAEQEARTADEKHLEYLNGLAKFNHNKVPTTPSEQSNAERLKKVADLKVKECERQAFLKSPKGAKAAFKEAWKQRQSEAKEEFAERSKKVHVSKVKNLTKRAQ